MLNPPQKFLHCFLLFVSILFSALPLFAQDEAKELAKKSQNPVTDLTSLPLENDLTFPTEPGGGIQYVLNIQPVIPVTVGPLNLIHRVILPIVSQPQLVSEGPSAVGLGDITFQMLIAPNWDDKLLFGVGPNLVFPSATDSLLGQGKLSLGPLLGIFTVQESWVGGILINNVWSVAGDDLRASVNEMQLQPTLNYTFNGGWFLTSTPTINADWESPNNQRWTVPVGGGGGKVFKIGGQPINLNTQVFYNAIRPQGFGKITWCLTLQFLFPKKN